MNAIYLIFFQIAEFVDEVLILRQLRHTNIVLFMSYILNPPTDMCIVMHWCSSSLYRRVHVKKEEITVSKAIRIAIETAQVNSRNIIDVNSPTFRALNILFSNRTVKLKIPGKAFLKSGCRTSVTFKL